MGTKRIAILAVTLVFVLGGMFYLQRKTAHPTALRVCTWSNYYPEAILKEFTAKTGIQVELSFISSNEELFSKLKAGATGFDIIQPSDYMVRQMGRLSMLQEIDASKLPNLSHLDNFYRTLPYDPGLKISVPFTWGTTGIAVNTAKVKLPAGEVGWELLFNSPLPKQTSMLDDMREAFVAALMFKRMPFNSTDSISLEAAKEQVASVKNKILMFSSEPLPLLLKEEISIAQAYSTDAIQAGKQNPNIKYFIPKEGATIWTDSFAIPKSSQKANEAHTFINYFLDPENGIKISLENLLSTPNKSVREKLPPELKNNPNLYPPAEVMNRLHFMEDMGEALNTVNRMWTELKS